MPAAISTYQWFLSAHILAAVLWVGGAFTIQVLATRAVRANDGPWLAALTREIAWVGSRLFAPASLLLMVFGFLLIHEGDWGYPFWVVFPIVVWALSFMSGSGFLGPQSGKLAGEIERYGIDSAQARARLGAIVLVSRVELALLLLVVLDMVLKPGA